MDPSPGLRRLPCLNERQQVAAVDADVAAESDHREEALLQQVVNRPLRNA